MHHTTFAANAVTRYNSAGVDFQAVLELSAEHSASVSVLHFDRDGVLGEHVAPSWQLFVLINGRIQVTSGDEARTLEPGDAVQWSPGESHRSRALRDSTVLMLQGSTAFLPTTVDF